jgi:hypothetical protein
LILIQTNTTNFFKRKKKGTKTYQSHRRGQLGHATFGEPPSYFYKDESEKNVEKIKTYYKNHGFFSRKFLIKSILYLSKKEA